MFSNRKLPEERNIINGRMSEKKGFISDTCEYRKIKFMRITFNIRISNARNLPFSLEFVKKLYTNICRIISNLVSRTELKIDLSRSHSIIENHDQESVSGVNSP